MKVKIIEGNNPRELELNINEFIQHKHVVDIKFITCTDDMYNDIFSALIMYENTSSTQIKQKTLMNG